MKLPSFLLDHWLAEHEFASPPIRFNLASSTGPAWTLAELLALGEGAGKDLLGDIRLSYAPPQGSQRLRERIGQFHGVDPDWVVVTTGASEALSMLFCLATEQAASVTLPSPAFPAIPAMAKAWRLDVQCYALDRNSGFAQTADAVLGAIHRNTRLVLVNTPHNPTGSVMPEAEMAKLAALLHERGVPLIVDEVYHPLYFGPQMSSAAKLANAIVVGDFSKALSLSGLRLGWIIDRDPVRRERLIDIRSYFTISGSPLLEAVAVHALTHSAAILSRLEDVARTNLARLERFMEHHRDIIGWVPPQGGTVSAPWLRDGRDVRPLCLALARAGVLVVPGDCFEAAEHFRIGIGAQADGFQEALEIATSVLAAGRF